MKHVDFEEALVVELASVPSFANRIFPLFAVEGTEPPFIVYVSSEGEQTQVLTGFTDLKEIRCELHVIAKSYAEMKKHTKEVIDQITSFFGRSIGINGPFVKSISYEQPREFHEQDFGYYQSSFDMHIWMTEEELQITEPIETIIALLGSFKGSSQMNGQLNSRQSLSAFIISTTNIKEKGTIGNNVSLECEVGAESSLSAFMNIIKMMTLPLIKSVMNTNETIFMNTTKKMTVPLIESVTDTNATINRISLMALDEKIACISSVSGGMDLIKTISLSTSSQSTSLIDGELSVSSLPQRIGNLSAWYSADEMQLNDNDLVSSWNDISGNNRHALANGTERPTFKTNEGVGLPSIYFNANNLNNLRVDFGKSFAIPNTFIIVAKFMDSPVLSNNYIFDGLSSGGRRALFTTNTKKIQAYATSGLVTNDPVTYDQFLLLNVSYKTVGSTIRLNGIQLATTGDTGSGTTFSGLFFAKSYLLNSDFYSNLHLSEFLFYDKELSEEETTKIETYLKDKYNI